LARRSFSLLDYYLEGKKSFADATCKYSSFEFGERIILRIHHNSRGSYKTGAQLFFTFSG